MLSWVVAAFIFISFLITTVILLKEADSFVQDNQNASKIQVVIVVLGICYLIAFSNMIIWTALVTGSDPTDPTVHLERLWRQAKENKMAEPKFNPNDYSFYCDACDTHVLKNTKHCQRCNRCAYEFDHHCVWVSNDIGLHNYIDFMRMLTAVMCTILF